jgi:hypothetical protein
VPGLVARARDAGLQSIWVRTGGNRQGYYGDKVLPELVPAAHAAGLKVVAWDFPFMSDPMADAVRAKQALDAGVDAIAPDVETTYEGTYATPRRVELYLSLVRSYAGTRPVAATDPRPDPEAARDLPVRRLPGLRRPVRADGLLVVQRARRAGRAVDAAPRAPCCRCTRSGRATTWARRAAGPACPPFAETWRFLDAAKRGGAVGASLWTIEQVGPEQWDALRQYPWDATP